MATVQEMALLYQEQKKMGEFNCKLPFLNRWEILLDKIPEYPEFEGEFTEQLDFDLSQIILDTDNPKYTIEMKTLFKNTVFDYMNRDGTVNVIHNQRFKMGRFYPDYDKSIIVHSKIIKHTLFKYLNYKDLDQVKGHPSIMVEIAKINNKQLPTIQYYINNFDKVVKELIKMYSDDETPLNNGDIKDLFNITIYGGGFDTWKKELEEGKPIKGKLPKKIKTENKHKFYIDFKKECDEFKNFVYQNNPIMRMKFKNDNLEIYELKNKMISYFLQIFENHFVYIAAKFLLENDILKPKKYSPEYDGLCLPPYESEMTDDEIIDAINKRELEETGFNVIYKFKGYSEFGNQDLIDKCIEYKKNKVIEVEEIDDNEPEEEEMKNDKANEYKDMLMNNIKDKKTIIEQQMEKVKTLEEEIKKGLDVEMNIKYKNERLKSINKEMKTLEKDERKLEKYIKQQKKEDEALLKQKIKDKKMKDKEVKLLKVNPILFDLTDAGFAKEFANKFFKRDDGEMPLIVFTGTEEYLNGYKFNGVYWESILHQAELHKNLFDELYKHYENELFRSKEFIVEETTYRGLVVGVKKLNSYHDRCNILKVFKTRYYVKDIKWNLNKDLFVFEDCVYNLSKGKFVEPNPEDYINITCGYSYHLDVEPRLIDEAKTTILDFVESVMDGVDERDYLMKVYSKGLKQSNDEEKAYFLIGDGRNGKGTNSLLNARALGNYWGVLNIEYYTAHRKSADEPNQNLFNCRNARILSTSEANDENEKGNKTKFLHDKFQTLTGKGILTPRALGEKTIAEFQAGIPILDFNFMVDFSKKDMSCVKERVEIIKFKKCFTQDTSLIEQDPSKYKMVDMSLKGKFEGDIYRKAMIELLFDYYRRNVKRPDSVKKETDGYFNNETLISWISSNCEKDEGEFISLDEIKEKYLTDTDKKLTIKTIKDELMKNKYEIRMKDGYYRLKGYKLLSE